MDKQNISLFISGGTIITMNNDRDIITDGAVAINNDRIIDVGEKCKLEKLYNPDHSIDATGKAILPGLINAHTHAVLILLRGGLSQDRNLYDWLINVLCPGMSVFTATDAKVAAKLFCIESIKRGSTTFVDNAGRGDAETMAVNTIDTYIECGLRAVYARMFNDHKTHDNLLNVLKAKECEIKHTPHFVAVEDTNSALDSIEALMKKYHGSGNGRISVWPAPGISSFVNEEGLLGALELANKYDVMVSTHISETSYDAKRFGLSMAQYLANIGFLNERLLAGHCVWVTDKDLYLLKMFNVKVANLAVSNQYLGSGIAPIVKMIHLGITVGLGTDDANCNDSINMFADMKHAALIQKAANLDASVMTAEKVIEMATIDGAKAIGLENEIGSIEIGKKADIIAVNLEHPHLKPCHHIPTVLIYQTNGSEVDTTIVNGKVLMLDGKLTHISDDEQVDLMKEVQSCSDKIVKRAGMDNLKNRCWKRFNF